jgi:D-alanyl-D-alanine carboxypeptidase (penicillin-binding protein 5/6)
LASGLKIRPLEAAAAILVEATTGQVLHERNADVSRAPASLAKLMLELVVLEKVEAGELRLEDPVRVSAWASKMGGSQVFLAQDEVFPLEELLKAIVIASANDACVAVAEHVSGSTEAFVALMNRRARELGLSRTRFINVHGLDDQPGLGNMTSARDIAAIACRLVTMPHVLDWASIRETPFRDGEFTLVSTNRLLGNFPDLDGLKTGYTRKAMFCLCATAERRGMRLISVILGAPSNRARFRESSFLLGSGFTQLQKTTLVEAGATTLGGVPVSGGRKAKVQAAAAQAVAWVHPEDDRPPTPVLVPRRGLIAPVKRGDTVGVIELRSEGTLLQTPAIAATDLKTATLLQRLGRWFGAGS